jgi:hypothetical protein
MDRFSKCTLSILYAPLLSPTHNTSSAHLIILYVITRTIFREQYRSYSSLRSPFRSPVFLSLSGPETFLGILFSNALSLCSSFNVTDQVSHPYEPKRKIIVLCIFIFILLGSKLADN